MRKKILLSPLLIGILIAVFGVGAVGAAILIGGAGGTGEVNLQKGLVGWWKMDGNTKDSTPYGNNGTPNPCPAGHTNNGNGTCTATFFPSQDGYVGQNPGNAVFATVHDATSGNDVGTTANSIPVLNEKAAGIYYINRGFLYFDTSSLTSGATISSATLSLYGNGSFAQADSGQAANQLVEGTQGATLALSDYDNYNTTILTTSNPSWAYNLSSSAYTDATLNASGIAVISKTGTTKFAVLAAGDLANTAPTGNNTDRFWSSVKGAGFQPKLTVTYTPAAATATFTTDRKSQTNKAYNLNGTTNFLTIPDSNNWNFGSGDFTIGAWVNFSSRTGDQNFVSQYGDSGSNGAFAFVQGSNNVLYFFWSTTGSSELSLSASWNPSVSTWYYVTAVRSGTSIKTYVNNAVIGSGTLSGTIYNSTRNLNIGAYKDNGQLLNGKIDDVRIYNRALSAAELTASYEAYNPGIQVSDLQKGLIAHWDFNGNAKDSTPYGNNGTLTGTTLTTDRKGTANKAYSFNGSSDYMTFSSVLNTAGTISLWVKWLRDSVGYGAQDFIANFIFQHNANNYFYTRTWSGAYSYYAYAIPLNTWTHLVFTWTNSSDLSTSKLYADNVLYNPTAGGGGYGSIAGISGLAYGGSWGGNYLNAIIDDVRAYNRALSATEIADLRNEYDPGIAVSTLQKGLVGNWKFDGNAKDSTPYGNNGTLTGTTLTTDRKGTANKAYSFNGSTDNVNLGKPSSLNFQKSTNFSWSFWIKPNNLVGYQSILSEHDSTNYKFIGLDQGTQGGIRFDYGTSADVTGAIITAGVWQHLVLTHIADTTNYLVYLNGSLNDTLVSTGTGTSTNNLLLGISTSSNFPFNGSMDDVRIYNRALSAAEVLALYQGY